MTTTGIFELLYTRRPGFRGNPNWMELLVEAKKHVSCDMFYCSILADNKCVMNYFTRKRENIPHLEKVCDYTTYVMNPRAIAQKRWELADSSMVFRKASQNDLDRIHEFLNREGQKHDFFPKIGHLEQDCYDLRAEDCFLLERDHKITAFTALWNQSGFRQYIVTKYNKPLNYMRRVDKLTQLLGYVPFPREGQVLDFPHFAFLLVEDNDPWVYKHFLYKVSREIKKQTDMAVIGIPNESPLKREVYDKLRALSFQSTLYFINFSGKEVSFDKELFIECGLL